MTLFSFILTIALDVIPMQEAFLRPLVKRDSVLIADQVEYGVKLDGLSGGFFLPQLKTNQDTLALVRDWKLDTLKTGIQASIVLAPFEAGIYELPDIPVINVHADRTDTLIFKGLQLDVREPQIDTATFKPHDLKEQINYPVTALEVVTGAGIGLGVIAAIALVVFLITLLCKPKALKKEIPKDPAHIVALRELDKYRSNEFWVPEKQKALYSGITDTLKAYIDERYGIDAPEMTTDELFTALRDTPGLPADLQKELKAMFETADIVKFAKATTTEQEASSALPLAVRFVTNTYQENVL